MFFRVIVDHAQNVTLHGGAIGFHHRDKQRLLPKSHCADAGMPLRTKLRPTHCVIVPRCAANLAIDLPHARKLPAISGCFVVVDQREEKCESGWKYAYSSVFLYPLILRVHTFVKRKLVRLMYWIDNSRIDTSCSPIPNIL